MASDPDAIWKPGYEPSTDPPSTDRPSQASTPSSTECRAVRRSAGADVDIEFAVDAPAAPAVAERPRSARRIVIGAVAAAALLVVAAAVITRSPSRPDVGPIGAADERRLPTSVDERWSVTLPGTGAAISTDLFVAGGELVVVVVDDGSRDRTSIAGLDAATGAIRWRTSFAFSPPEVRILGVVGERVILEQTSPSTSRQFALSTVNGAGVWSSSAGERTFAVILQGTGVIARVIQPENDGERVLTDFVDPASGEFLGVVVGRPLSSDLSGNWLFGDEDGLVSIDLSDGWSEPELVSDLGVGAEEQVALVDGRFIVRDVDGSLAELAGDPDGAIGDRRRLTIVDTGLPELQTIFPSGGRTFVGVGTGVVVGAQLVDDVVRRTWEIEATVRTVGVTERGVVLSLSDAGAGFVDGVDFVVVDAVTGERLAASGPAPDTDQLPLIVGDGFIITQTMAAGRDRIGYDLDGTERWRLPAVGKLRIGDELLATLDNTPAGFEITIYGPDELGPGDTVGGND